MQITTQTVTVQDKKLQKAVVNFINVALSFLMWIEKARKWILGAIVIVLFAVSLF
jgi:hypothetical protein